MTGGYNVYSPIFSTSIDRQQFQEWKTKIIDNFKIYYFSKLVFLLSRDFLKGIQEGKINKVCKAISSYNIICLV